METQEKVTKMENQKVIKRAKEKVERSIDKLDVFKAINE
jgi:hypothetical protein